MIPVFKQLKVVTGKNFTVLMKGAKAELFVIEGADGAPEAVAQVYTEENAKEIAHRYNCFHRLMTSLVIAYESLKKHDLPCADVVKNAILMGDEIYQQKSELRYKIGE